MKMFLLSMLLFLAACDHVRQQGNTDYANALDNCTESRRSGQLKTYVAQEECGQSAIPALLNSGYPYPDLIYRLHSFRMSMAKKMDAKKISPENASEALLAEQNAINGEIAQRDIAQRQINSSNSQFWYGMAAQSMQPPAYRAQPQTCYMERNGNSGGWISRCN
jgi:hypothetical protein